MKKVTILFASFFLLSSLELYAADNYGRIVLKEGIIKKTNLNCTDEKCGKDIFIYKGDRIKTGNNSRVQILLSDGTGILVYERSDIIINNIKSGDNKKPTSLYAEYGRFKIIQDNNYMDTSLVITTKNCIVKSVCSTFCFAAAENESGILVLSGEAGFASTSSSVSAAYIIKTGEESFIKSGNPPSVPVRVTAVMQSSWLSRMVLSKDRKRILQSGIDKRAVDWPLMKKD